MAVKKKKIDKTLGKRVAKTEQKKRDAGLVPVSLKVWVRADKEVEARELLQQAKKKAEEL